MKVAELDAELDDAIRELAELDPERFLSWSERLLSDVKRLRDDVRRVRNAVPSRPLRRRVS